MEARVFGVVLLGAAWIGLCEGIPYDLFYSYGYQFGDTVLERGDDVSSNEVSLDVPIVYYDQRYNSIFVSTTILFAFSLFFSTTLFLRCSVLQHISLLHKATLVVSLELDTRMKTLGNNALYTSRFI